MIDAPITTRRGREQRCGHCGEALAPGAIVVSLWPEEKTRTPERACYYTAVTIIDSVEYRGRSRYGAGLELARVLVAAGLPDAPMHVHHLKDPEMPTGGLRGHLAYHSFHAAAEWTIEEGDRGGPVRRRWKPSPDFKQTFSHRTSSETLGSIVSDEVEVAEEA